MRLLRGPEVAAGELLGLVIGREQRLDPELLGGDVEGRPTVVTIEKKLSVRASFRNCTG